MSGTLGLAGYESSDEEASSDPELTQKEHNDRKGSNPQSKGFGRQSPPSRRLWTDIPPISAKATSQITKNELTPAISKEAFEKPNVEAEKNDSTSTNTVTLDHVSIARPSPLPPQPTPDDTPVPGPSLGPARPPSIEAEDEPTSNLQSPYSTTRSQLRNLTMPPVPSFNIPPSPPGSPPPKITQKFEQFLELKAKGRHFNENLSKSSALRNPTLLQKLMGFAGISEEDQYATTLPPETAVPTKFPEWAYGDQLDKVQKAITKRREEEAAKKQRDSLTFVKASGSSASSASTTPGTAPRAGRSTAERVMAELDRKGPQSQVRVGGQRGGRAGSSKSRFDQRSRSPR